MFRRSLLLASFAALVAAPVVASAQDTVSRGGEVARVPSYATLLAAISGTHGTAAQIQSLPATLQATDVRIVEITTLVTTEKETEFNEAFERHKAERDSLQAAIQQNQVLSQALGQHESKANATDVVAAEVMPDGEVVLYVRKPKEG